MSSMSSSYGGMLFWERKTTQGQQRVAVRLTGGDHRLVQAMKLEQDCRGRKCPVVFTVAGPSGPCLCPQRSPAHTARWLSASVHLLDFLFLTWELSGSCQDQRVGDDGFRLRFHGNDSDFCPFSSSCQEGRCSSHPVLAEQTS